MDIQFGEHRCEVCSEEGHCSLELAARFFGADLEELEEFSSKIEALGKDWRVALLANAGVHSDPIGYVIQISLATGFALARGAEPMEVTPSVSKVIDSILNIVGKMPTPGMDNKN